MPTTAPEGSSGHTVSSRERIVAAARSQIESKGILGLRVQDVAAEANVSVPLIYKYFDDRDGLLAEVLGRLFEEVVLDSIDAAESMLGSISAPTVDDFVKVFALPHQEWRRSTRWMRIQILAASMEIPALRDRLGVVQTHINDRVADFLTKMQLAATGEVRVPPRALALWVQGTGFGFVLNDIVDEDAGVTDADYTKMLRTMFSPMFDPR